MRICHERDMQGKRRDMRLGRSMRRGGMPGRLQGGVRHPLLGQHHLFRKQWRVHCLKDIQQLRRLDRHLPDNQPWHAIPICNKRRPSLVERRMDIGKLLPVLQHNRGKQLLSPAAHSGCIWLRCGQQQLQRCGNHLRNWQRMRRDIGQLRLLKRLVHFLRNRPHMPVIFVRA